jgi:hypothetical protein
MGPDPPGSKKSHALFEFKDGATIALYLQASELEIHKTIHAIRCLQKVETVLNHIITLPQWKDALLEKNIS